MHWEGRQNRIKGLQGIIYAELGLMFSPFCYGGHMVSYEPTQWPDTNAELLTYTVENIKAVKQTHYTEFIMAKGY